MLVLMLGPPRLPRSMGFSVNCLFVQQFVQVRMLALNKSAKTRELNGAPALIFLPGVMEETQLALVEH